MNRSWLLHILIKFKIFIFCKNESLWKIWFGYRKQFLINPVRVVLDIFKRRNQLVWQYWHLGTCSSVVLVATSSVSNIHLSFKFIDRKVLEKWADMLINNVEMIRRQVEDWCTCIYCRDVQFQHDPSLPPCCQL